MPKSTKVRSHGNNVRDVIIAHVISADAHTNRRGNSKVILGPAGRALCTRPAGKNGVDLGMGLQTWVQSKLVHHLQMMFLPRSITAESEIPGREGRESTHNNTSAEGCIDMKISLDPKSNF